MACQIIFFPELLKQSKDWNEPAISAGPNQHLFKDRPDIFGDQYWERVKTTWDGNSPKVRIVSLIADTPDKDGVIYPLKVLQRASDIINKGNVQVTVARSTSNNGQSNEFKGPENNYLEVGGTAINSSITLGQLDFYIAIHHLNGTVGPVGTYLYEKLMSNNNQSFTLRWKANIVMQTNKIIKQFDPIGLQLISYDDVDIYRRYNNKNDDSWKKVLFWKHGDHI